MDIPKVIWVGDSQTYNPSGGSGITLAEAALEAKGYVDGSVYVNAVIGRRLVDPDSTGQTTLTAITAGRAALGGEADLFIVAVGGNGSTDSNATTDSQVNQILNHIGNGKRIVWINLTNMNDDDADRIRRNGRIEAMCAARVNAVVADWRSYVHNGRDESGLWDTGDGIHMTTAGYNLRRQFIVDFVGGPRARYASHSENGNLVMLGF